MKQKLGPFMFLTKVNALTPELGGGAAAAWRTGSGVGS